MKKTVAFAVVDDIFIVVHAAEPPSDVEWDRLLDAAFALQGTHEAARTLVSSEGGAPTTAQRHRMDQRIRALVANSTARGRVAILGQSTFVRAVINASIALEEGWFGRITHGLRGGPASSRVYRAFDPAELRQALAWLGGKPVREAEIARVLAALRDEVRG